MRHTIHLLVDEIPAALRRTAHLLGTTLLRVERLSVASEAGHGRGRLTIVVEAPPGAPVLELFTDAVGAPRTGWAPAPKPSTGRSAWPVAAEPFHWQADGAGDSRAG
ncbi:MAG: hypothetical protein ABI647_13805 [Gemmatimonadota bacterium]